MFFFTLWLPIHQLVSLPRRLWYHPYLSAHHDVCLSLCQSAGYLKKLWMDCHEILWNGRPWLREQLIRFWWWSKVKEFSCFTETICDRVLNFPALAEGRYTLSYESSPVILYLCVNSFSLLSFHFFLLPLWHLFCCRCVWLLFGPTCSCDSVQGLADWRLPGIQGTW